MKLCVIIEFQEDDLFDFIFNDINKEYQKLCIKERLQNGLQKKNEKKLEPEKFSARSRSKKN